MKSTKVRGWKARPAEWVVAAFLLYLGGCMALAGRVTLAGSLPRLELLVALMVVTFVRLAVEYRRTEWKKHDRSFFFVHWLGLPLCLAPALAIAAEASSWWPRGDGGGRLATFALALESAAVHTLAVALPLLLLWLELGLHLKRYGKPNGRAFFRETGIRLGMSIREWAPPMLLIYGYGVLGGVLREGLLSGDRDALLAHADRLLFLGRDPWPLLERAIRPWLSEWLSFAYVFYLFLFPLVFGALWCKRQRGPFRELALAVTLTMAIGFACYPLVPAMGPLFTMRFHVPLDSYYFGWIKTELVDRLRVPRDCFPSVHTALALVFLWSAWRHARRLFWMLAPVAASIPLACIYLRYHYVADVVAGVLLAALAARLSARWSVLESANAAAGPA